MQDMAGLVEHVMINKLNDDLDSAITFAGGDTSGVTNIMQYPQIIREQLGSGNIPTSKSIILEGDSCIITSSPEGWDEYNTDYVLQCCWRGDKAVGYMRLPQISQNLRWLMGQNIVLLIFLCPTALIRELIR